MAYLGGFVRLICLLSFVTPFRVIGNETCLILTWEAADEVLDEYIHSPAEQYCLFASTLHCLHSRAI